MLWTGLHQHLKYRFGDKSDAIKDSAELRRAIRQVEQDSQPHQSATGNSKKLTSEAAQPQQDDKYQQIPSHTNKYKGKFKD